MKTVKHLLRQRFPEAILLESIQDDSRQSCRLSLPNASPTEYKRLAIILSHDEDYLEEATLLHLIANLNRMFDPLPEIDILCADHDQQRLEHECLAYVIEHADQFSACITLSPWTTSQAFRLITMGGIKVPLIFGNINDPKGLGLLTNEYRSKYLAGVVSETQNYQQQLETMKDIFPSFNRLIIPYDTLLHGHRYSNIEHGNMAALIDQCDRLNIDARMLGLTPGCDVTTEINAFDTNGTICAITRESSVMVKFQDILNAAITKGMPIFSDMPLPTICGAAFGTGSGGALTGPPLAQLVYNILAEKQSPGSLTFRYIKENRRLLFNQEKFVHQGIRIDERTRRLIETQDVATLSREKL